MSVQLFYGGIMEILKERKQMPVDMLAWKLGISSSSTLEALEKLQQVNLVALDADKKIVKISTPDSIPTRDEFYSIAG
jgi:DNA-binding transcriptional regulator GbsR (MarR family)